MGSGSPPPCCPPLTSVDAEDGVAPRGLGGVWGPPLPRAPCGTQPCTPRHWGVGRGARTPPGGGPQPCNPPTPPPGGFGATHSVLGASAMAVPQKPQQYPRTPKYHPKHSPKWGAKPPQLPPQNPQWGGEPPPHPTAAQGGHRGPTRAQPWHQQTPNPEEMPPKPLYGAGGPTPGG